MVTHSSIFTWRIPWTGGPVGYKELTGLQSDGHTAVLRILQARIQEWVAVSSTPGVLPNPGIKPWSPALQGGSLPSEPPSQTHVYF